MSDKYEEIANLDYKEHSEFFNDYYEAKKKFNRIVNMAYLDFSLVGDAFAALFEYVGSCLSQINNELKGDEINQKKNELVNLIKSKQSKEALDEMTLFFEKVCNINANAEIEPKPKVNVIKNFDKEILAIKEAYKILGVME